MANISYTITIGTKTYATPNSPSLQTLTVHNALAVPVSSAEIVLAVHDTFTPGQAVSIALGNGNNTSTVFTGMVKATEQDLHNTTVYACSTMEPLTRLYIDAVYEGQSCGAIFSEVAGLVKASTGPAEAGVTWPRYVLNSSRNAWQHLHLLASYAGADLYTDANDQLQFALYQQGTAAAFTYGQDILEAHKEAYQPGVDGVVVYGDGPGSSTSDETNTWFKKEAIQGTAGKTSGTVQRHAVYAARSQELCTTIAKNLFTATQSTAKGRALVLNGQAAQLGKTITLKGVPATGIDGSYKITAIHHQVTQQAGYTTEIEWEATA